MALSRTGRILAIDPGEKRIGVAAADLRTRVALPLTTIEPGDDPVEAIARLAEERGAEAIVVGLALSLTGAMGEQAQRGQALAEGLARRLGVPVHTWDERLSSVEARRHAGRGRRSGRGKPRRRDDLDAVAAAIILQAYLDSKRPPRTE